MKNPNVYISKKLFTFEDYKKRVQSLNVNSTIKQIKKMSGIDTSNILTNSTKTQKSYKELQISNFVLYLSQAKISGYNLCPMSGNCEKLCLADSGFQKLEKFGIRAGSLKFSATENKKLQRTYFFKLNKDVFFKILNQSIENKAAKFEKLVIRLNGTSDILHRNFAPVYDKNKAVNFVEYTKIPGNAIFSRRSNNLYTVFSFDGPTNVKNSDHSKSAINNCFGVAVCFNEKLFNSLFAEGKNTFEYKGHTIVNGDLFDTRNKDREFYNLDPGKGYIIGLKFKETFSVNKHDATATKFVCDKLTDLNFI